VYYENKYITPSLKEEKLAVPKRVHRSDIDLLETKKLPDDCCALSKSKVNTKAIDMIRYEAGMNILWIFQLKYSDQKVNEPDKKDRNHTKAIPALLDAAQKLKAKFGFKDGLLQYISDFFDTSDLFLLCLQLSACTLRIVV
jgi:hypothetical protein